MEASPHFQLGRAFEEEPVSPEQDVFEMTPEYLKQRRASSKREAAARFINCTVIGANVPHDSCDAFRAALADGVLLCRLLNCLKPGTIPHIIEEGPVSPASGIRRSFENITNFLQAVLGFTTETFCAADLEAPGEKPQVVECILSLQDWYHAALQRSHSPVMSTNSASSPAFSFHGAAPAASTPLAAPLAAAAAAASFSFTPAANDLVARHGPGVVRKTDGLEYLMQSCAHMLKSKMGMPASPLPPMPSGSSAASEIALDAVGPVLETVLANLTTEYERRLVAKDEEHKQQADAVEKLRQQVVELEAQAAKWKDYAESGAAAAAATASVEAAALKAQERAEYERLCQSEAALLCELAAKKRELEALQNAAAASEKQADAEIAELRAMLTHYRAMEERYKAIKEENRQLYNTVQDLRGSIRVFCRVRPRGATGDYSQSIVEVGEDGALAAFSAKHNKWHEYKFDRVFGEDSKQEEIYQETKPLVRSVLDGFNICIFAYGQTGSGKTHTMSGNGDGINFRALEDLFEQREDRAGETEYTIKVQLVEIYNEVIRDLLVSETEARNQRSLGLVATRGSGNNLPDATQVIVRSAEEVAAWMEHGSRNRAVAETKMNERSSRSHQVLTVMVEGASKATHSKTHGCLHLIDLAGSERVSRSGAEGKQLLEAQHINKSLSALGNVMAALAQKRDHIPFRDSKLTQLLADSLSGQAKSMMFCHVAPEESSVSETLSTLNFGRGVTEITLGAAKRNVESGAIWEARELKDKLAAARGEASAEREARASAEREVAELKEKVRALEQQLATANQAPSSNSMVTNIAENDFGTIPAVWDRTGNGDEGRSSTGLSRPPQVGRLNLSKMALGSSSFGNDHSSTGTPGRDQIQALSRGLGSVSVAQGTKIPTPLSRSTSLTARASYGHKSSPFATDSAAEPLISRRRSGTPVEAKTSLAAAAAQSMLPRSRSGLSSSGSFNNNRSSFGREEVATPRTARGTAAAAPVSSRRWM